ncbi:MAG: PTS sugar transporter subunit IIC [Solobacterium sp.]|nr:PTS sugar transporter subunit IIC [Solobacterium sp.]
MNEKFMNFLLNVAGKVSNNKYLSAIRDSFTDLMPVIIAGSFCTLFANVICNTTPGYMSVANIPGMSWLGMFKPLFTAANYGTMNMLAVAIVILLSGKMAKTLGNEDKVVPVVALASFVSLCTTTATAKAAESGEAVTISNVLASSFTSAQGLFVGMLVGIFAAIIYVMLLNSGRFRITMPDSVPSNIARSFEVLFPSTLTILIISAVGMFFEMFLHMSLFEAITKFIQAPLTNVLTGLPGYCLLIFMTVVLWFFGIHGTQTLKGIYEPVLLAAFAENEAAYAAGETIPHIINRAFLSNFSVVTGAGITGGLVLAILLFSKRDDYRQIAKLELPCAIFNINEPMVFGLPIVMNPIMGIPFMIAPVAASAFAYFMSSIGFCGKLVVNAPWTTPLGLEAFIASGGSFGAVITQILCVLLAFAIYTPFVLISNKQSAE